MKTDDRKLFQALLHDHPEFLDIVNWADGPDPPDIVATDRRDRLLGVELTEWLDSNQATHSITIEDHEMKWLEVVNQARRPPLRNISRVTISFRHDTKFKLAEAERFCREFHDLLERIDACWESEIVSEPFRIWQDFEEFPTLVRHVRHLWFPLIFQQMPAPEQGWWISGEAKGGAYDPHWAASALLERIRNKVGKPGYSKLKSGLGLSELILLVHYGIRGVIHNTPFKGVNQKAEDVLEEARGILRKDPGPFDRVFLYFAFNQGDLFVLYP